MRLLRLSKQPVPIPARSLPLRYPDRHLPTIANWKKQTTWTGDNLDVMRGINGESVDLIYPDPLFNCSPFKGAMDQAAFTTKLKDTGLSV